MNPLTPKVIDSRDKFGPYQYDCPTCKDSGAVIAQVVDDPIGAPYAFACLCPKGQRRRKYPSWGNADPKVFRVMS
jgi:hypothetical protein